MKNYLNRDERQIATFLCVMYGLVENLVANDKNLSKDERTALKYTHTYLDKYIMALMNRVGRDEGERIYREVIDKKILLKPKTYNDGQLIVDKHCLEEVARMAVETHCFGCKREDWRNCGLYQCMDKLDMGEIYDGADKCDFYYEEE